MNERESKHAIRAGFK